MSWTPQQKAAWAKAEEKHFKSHRDTPSGRNFVFWNNTPSREEEDKYRSGFDAIFPKAPGAGV